MYIDTIAPSRIDIEAELRAVQSALSTATARRSRIEREIRETTGIEALSGLHDAWSLICEEQLAAAERRRELSALLK